MITLQDIDYKNIPKKNIEKTQKLLKDNYHEHLKELYSINKKKIYKIKKDRINVLMFPGSVNIIIQVLPKRELTLTNEEKELLEYHNFRRVFIQGLEPITEFEFKKIRHLLLKKLNK